MKGAYLLVIASALVSAFAWCIYDLIHPELASDWLHDPYWCWPCWLFGGTFVLATVGYSWWRG